MLELPNSEILSLLESDEHLGIFQIFRSLVDGRSVTVGGPKVTRPISRGPK